MKHTLPKKSGLVFKHQREWILGFLLVFFCTSGFSQIKYVNGNASGSNNGSSWTNAYNDLNTAILAASPGDQIWVAAGSYLPPAYTSFVMKNGVGIYGGFAGTEQFLNQRNWVTNVTVLAGSGSNVINNSFTSSAPLLTTAILDGFTVMNGNCYQGGAGIYNSYASPTLSNLIITANTSANGGGGLYFNNNSSPAVNNLLITGNTSYYDGGGILIYNSLCTLNTTTITGNSGGSGGGLAIIGSTVTINGVLIANNDAYMGGGAELINCTTFINNTSVISNTSTSEAGGMVNGGACFMNGVQLLNNTCGGGGGGIANSGTLTATNCTIAGNSANTGGGIYNSTTAFSVLNYLSIASNTAAYGRGGGIASIGSLDSLTNVVFSNCSSVYGGGIYSELASPVMHAVTFLSNTAYMGGGLFNTRSSPIISNSKFNNNSAGWAGGGMYNESVSSPTVLFTSFTSNSATANGGGMFNDSSAAQVYNTLFQNNWALNFGGAICNFTSSAVLKNVAMVTNTAVAKGGGLYNESCSPLLINVTIAANKSGNGGGLFDHYSYPKGSNSIIYGNMAPTGSNISNGVSDPTFSFCLVQGTGGSANWTGGYNLDGGGNIDTPTSPFAPGGYQLANGSPAINAGKTGLYTGTITTDVQNNQRLIGCSIDMGAYEYQTAVAGASASIGGNLFLCPGDSTLLNANPTLPGQTYLWNANATLTTNTLNVSSPGVYSVQVTEANGSCTTSAQALVVLSALSPPTIVYNHVVFFQGSFTSCQWYLNGVAISGATTQTYLPGQSGIYTVQIIDAHGCSVLSAPYNLVAAGIPERAADPFVLFPNPVNSSLYLNLNQTVQELDLSLSTAAGQLILERVFYSTKTEVMDLSGLSPGVYLLKIKTDDQTFVKKVIKK